MEDLMPLVSEAIKQNIDWVGFEAALSSFVFPMSQTRQNPAFHGEGDVWTHTKLVCRALIKLENFSRLSEDRQTALFLAALLHDIGKIPATRQEDGQWISPNHSLTGAKMARQFLWQVLGFCGTPEKLQLRETVCNLIRYHSVPPHAIDDPEGKRKLLAIASNGALCPMFTLELLCILCRADALGRECADKGQLLEQIELCEELARESGCYNQPFAFPSDHTRYACLSGKEIAPETLLYDDTWGEVILMSGLPGTGKDTWIKDNIPDLPMISLDAIRKELNISPTGSQNKVVEAARNKAKELLRKKQCFVWNATNVSPMVRSRQIKLFTQYHASVRIIYLETDLPEQLRRNAGRADTVPEQAIFHMMQELVLPEVKEAHRVQWLCV